MSDNTVTQEDRDAEAAYLRELSDQQQWAIVFSHKAGQLAKHFAAHRTGAVAKRDAEIVGKIMEYANIANERYVYDDLRKLCAIIQGRPLPKSTAEIVQEQIGRSMDREDKFPSIE